MEKKINSAGQKAYQRSDREDRSLIYRDWLRKVKTGGYFIDVDMLKIVWKDGTPTPVALTEITRCDRPEITDRYLRAIEYRWFKRDRQGQIIKSLAELMNIPAYIVLFQKELNWIYAYSFDDRAWTKHTTDTWADYLSNLE